LGGSDFRPSATRRGREAESISASYLEEQGIALLSRNYRGPVGEIDIVGIDSGVICFIEVRSRQSSAFIHPIETISPVKQRRIIKTAVAFLMQEYDGRFQTYPCRFDVVVLIVPILGLPKITWIKDAFRLPG